MSKRLRILVSALCALFVMVACALYASHVREEADRERSETLKRYGGDTVTLVVTNRVIEAGEVVSLADVSMRDWISSLAPEQAFLSVDEVVGKEISVPATANVPLCALNFRDESQITEIPAGHVAVSMPVTDKLGLSSAVLAGAHVVAYRVGEGTAEVIGASAIVLAVPSSTGLSAGRGSITVAVKADDVPAILSAGSSGDLRLVVPAEDVREAPAPKTDNRDVPPADSGNNSQKEQSQSGEGQAPQVVRQDNTEEGA